MTGEVIGELLASLRVLRKQRHHAVCRSAGLLPDIRIQIRHGGERFFNADNVIGRVDGVQPRPVDIRIGGVDLVSGLQLGAFRGIHRVDAKDAATNQVNASIASVRRSGGIKCLRGEPWLPLAQLHFRQRRKRAGRVGSVAGGLVRPGPGVGNPALMQQGMNQGRIQFQIVRFSEKGL